MNQSGRICKNVSRIALCSWESELTLLALAGFLKLMGTVHVACYGIVTESELSCGTFERGFIEDLRDKYLT